MFCTVFGVQRSGTNYIEHLMKENFQDVKVRNQDSNYVWKHCAYPENYKNKLTDQQNINIVVYKNPYKWVESIMRYNADLQDRFGGKKGEYVDLYKTVKEGDLTIKDKRGRQTNVGGACRLYNDFYTNWLKFKQIEVTFVRYEDLLTEQNRILFLQEMMTKYKLKKKHSQWTNPNKVGQSDPWNDQRTKQYLQMENFDTLQQVHIDLIDKYIDDSLLEKFNYPKITERGWSINKKRN